MKNQAHDCPTREKDFTTDALFGQFRVESMQEMQNAFRGQHYTRAPMLESIKILRRRNGGGDAVSRCNRKFSEGSINTGVLNGSTVEVQRGGTTLDLWAAISTMAVT